MRSAKRFLYHAILIFSTALIVRFVGLAFNVYLTDRLGASGIGLYSLIMSVYALAVTFAFSGINLATTRVIAEQRGKNSVSGEALAMKVCIVYCLIFGMASAFLLFFLAEPIGRYLLSDSRTILPLKLLSINLPFLSASACLNGYFTAIRKISNSAFEQILEMVVRMTVTIYALSVLFPGQDYACTVVVWGSCISEFAAFAYSLLSFVCYTKKHKISVRENTAVQPIRKSVVSTALPIAFSSYIRSGLVTVEHLLIPIGLKKYGHSSDSALASYGIVHGMALPVLLFPAAILQAFTGLIIPEIAESGVRGETKHTGSVIKRVMQFTLIFAMAVSGIMYFFSYEIGLAIYNSAEASKYIKLIAPLIPIMYTDTIIDSILKGLGEQIYNMKVNILDAALCVVLVYTLIPKIGIYGYIAVIYISELLNFVLSLNRLISHTGYALSFIKSFLKPAICIGASASLVRLFFCIFPIIFPSALLELLFIILAVILLYMLFMRITLGIDREDIRWFKGIFARSEKAKNRL